MEEHKCSDYAEAGVVTENTACDQERQPAGAEEDIAPPDVRPSKAQSY